MATSLHYLFFYQYLYIFSSILTLEQFWLVKNNNNNGTLTQIAWNLYTYLGILTIFPIQESHTSTTRV